MARFHLELRRQLRVYGARTCRMPPLIVTCAVNGGAQGGVERGDTRDSGADRASCKEAYDAGASRAYPRTRRREPLGGRPRTRTLRGDQRAGAGAVPRPHHQQHDRRRPHIRMETRFPCLDARPELARLNMGPDMSRTASPPRPAPLPHPHEGLVYDDACPSRTA